MDDAIFQIYRYDPDGDRAPRYDRFRVPLRRGMTVLEVLLHLHQWVDGSLAFRLSCRSAVCGSCAMRINGRHTLACMTQVSEVLKTAPIVIVEPLENLPLLKDLVVDMGTFWSKMDAVKPWQDPTAPSPEGERLQSPMELDRIERESTCIHCGACVSSCTVLEVDPRFLAPAALAKAKRHACDSRAESAGTPWDVLNGPGGIWDCTRCMECVHACPKDVRPMEAILELRREALASLSGGETVGGRHVRFFVESVTRDGVLDERALPLQILRGQWLRLFGLIRTGIRMWWRGKVTLGPHHPVREVETMRRIVASVKEQR
ncbi:MAG: succinate dehydrogenase/fumarate reductase iron-sulfur subunit [Nitrospirae bacterium]|nr:succinate dehydrogenase/fumarate reductase iron-sulfur subunit [Nitrospirota bacterium]